MRSADMRKLFEFSYWANRELLSSVAALAPEQFVAPSSFTYRSLRDTLVHVLDVEWSWRIRLRGEHPELWETSLDPAMYSDVRALSEHWARDEAQMRGWLAGVDDADLEAIVDLGGRDRFPLWYFLMHIVSHGEQQRRDAQLLLRSFGQPVPDLEFLYFADAQGG